MKKDHEKRVESALLGTPPIETKLLSDLKRQIETESVDFGIVVALQKELKAVLHYFPELKRNDLEGNDVRSYYTGKIPAKGGHYRVVLTLLHSMGNLEAANATSDLISKWNPRYIMINGIAAGISRMQQQFGDILVSNSIMYYEGGKLSADKIDTRSRTFEADPALLDAMLNFDSYWKQNHPIIPIEQRTSLPHIHIGPIACGEKVIASAEEVERLCGINRKLVGIEMESAGVASASFSTVKKIGFLTIRSICDFADKGKDDNWQEYAAYAAAAFLRTFVESRPIGFSEGAWPLAGTQVEIKIPVAPKVDTTLRREIFERLMRTKDMEDLKSFCFLLGVDFDELPGQKKSSRITELILFFERKSELHLLESALNDDGE